ncbi:uncharacterized protein LOC131881099 [Tigriopus californicus]|uniref:uncharacterized protein LOC131881099 n=1 Tax=Tigriopus californicus TaxID=6832 RepID=UPI0027DA8EA7|nr:uncharacterized protein LOC131881099 [Tigriopus californicus]
MMREWAIHTSLLVLIVFIKGTWGSAQVDQEIDDYEDLLAVESSFSSNEITPLRAILPVPEGFNGQRLTRPQSSASISSDNRARIIRPDGSYTFSYSTNDGTNRDESGLPKANGGHVQSGGWSYISPEGRTISLQFEADENGYRPIGDHLPTPPPLPPALQRFEDAKAGRLNKNALSTPSKIIPNERNSIPSNGFNRKARKLIAFKRPLVKQGGRIAFQPVRQS